MSAHSGAHGGLIARSLWLVLLVTGVHWSDGSLVALSLLLRVRLQWVGEGTTCHD